MTSASGLPPQNTSQPTLIETARSVFISTVHVVLVSVSQPVARKIGLGPGNVGASSVTTIATDVPAPTVSGGHTVVDPV